MKFNHIYWFASYHLDSPSTRYRAKYPLDFLVDNQLISYDLIFPQRTVKGLLRFFKTYLKALFFKKSNDIIVIQKVCSNGFFAKALQCLVLFRKENTLYDLDDAEYLRQPTATLHFFLRHCEKITVGSEALCQYALQFNSKVYLQTSPVVSHCFQKKEKNDTLTIGWAGDVGNGNIISKPFSHKTSLFQLLFPALKLMTIPLNICILGVKNEADVEEIKAFFQEKTNINIEIPFPLNWQNDMWLYEKMTTWDIGVSPMILHPFNEAKSAFKAKQYLSCGLPVLASPTGENTSFVLDGQNGFICNNTTEFYDKIMQFEVMDKAKYEQMSRNALDSKIHFSIARYCTIFLKIMES